MCEEVAKDATMEAQGTVLRHTVTEFPRDRGEAVIVLRKRGYLGDLRAFGEPDHSG